MPLGRANNYLMEALIPRPIRVKLQNEKRKWQRERKKKNIKVIKILVSIRIGGKLT